MKNIFKTIGLVLLLTACNGLPSSYQGTYKDKNAGVTMVLHSGSAEMTFRGGRKIESDAQQMSFEKILEGKPGIYVTDRGRGDKGIVHFYYLKPTRGTLQKEEGFTWYKSEIIYTQADPNRDRAVTNLQVSHCTDGTVMLDISTKKVMMGCGAGATVYQMKRVSN